MNQASGFQVKPLGLVIPEDPLGPSSGLSPSEGPVRCRKVSGHEAGLIFLPVPVAYKVDRTEKDLTKMVLESIIRHGDGQHGNLLPLSIVC